MPPRDDPEPTHEVRAAFGSVSLALLALALLVAAVVTIRGAASGEPSTGLPRPAGAASAPHAGLGTARTDAMRAAIEAGRSGPADPAVGPFEPEGFEASSPDGSAGGAGRAQGCDAWSRVLTRDLTPVALRGGAESCEVAGGTLADPYLGGTLRYSHRHPETVAVDRIVPLEYAWRHGAASWPPARRQRFAADLANLVAVDARAVVLKDGAGPAGWLPQNVAIRCAYAARFVEVATRYRLTVAPEDLEVASRQCGS